ncbi:TIGR01777 family oxidoreductase [Salinibius halmophilus]|uniref:TIGR01777 family oxidoreductase n=1 Tax=Salinibius halmophilus TaxID=1853216 RepID=UPI000E662CA1|nr:TIGR01777 family oxidoreductase [Salinibius halmophilus]
MKVLITGGRGFLASHLLKHLGEHDLAVISRSGKSLKHCQQVFTNFEQAASFKPEVVINLAGASLFDQRWSDKRRLEMYQSRVDYTQKLLATLASRGALPSTLISGSAVGFYGDQGNQTITEANASGNDWSAKLCANWESQALAYSNRVRVCVVRTGLVMHPSGGAMAPLMTPAKLGLLGPFGKGDNYWPWIALKDWLNAVTFLINQPTCQGAFNLTAPMPETQKDFLKQLSKSLSRPSFFAIPSPAVNILLGSDRAELLMASQRVSPSRLLDAGFEFVYTNANSMLEAYAK